MTNLQIEVTDTFAPLPMLQPWYAIRTKPNHERTAATLLTGKDYTTFFPAYRVKRQWSDRVVEKELALFPGYLFCRFDVRRRMPILSIPSVISILGFGNEPTAIPDQEIEAIETVLASGLVAEPCTFLKEGQRIRVRVGKLAGLEGILLKKKNQCRLVVSIALLQRSISVEVDHDAVTAC